MVTPEAAEYYSYLWTIEGARPIVDTFDEYRDPTTLVESESDGLFAWVNSEKSTRLFAEAGQLGIILNAGEPFYELVLQQYPPRRPAITLATIKGGWVTNNQVEKYATPIDYGKATIEDLSLREWVQEVVNYYDNQANLYRAQTQVSYEPTSYPSLAYCSHRGQFKHL